MIEIGLADGRLERAPYTGGAYIEHLEIVADPEDQPNLEELREQYMARLRGWS